MKNEQRGQVRINNTVVVSYHVSSEKFLKMSCRSVDVSSTGIKLSLYQHLDKGKVYDFEIKFDFLPKPVTARGEIIWCRRSSNTWFPFTAGIKFINIDQDNAERLRMALSQLAKQEAPPESGKISLIKPKPETS
jgi:c-di-GMP-binding flagellar brake protein YcgR